MVARCRRREGTTPTAKDPRLQQQLCCGSPYSSNRSTSFLSRLVVVVVWFTSFLGIVPCWVVATTLAPPLVDDTDASAAAAAAATTAASSFSNRGGSGGGGSTSHTATEQQHLFFRQAIETLRDQEGLGEDWIGSVAVDDSSGHIQFFFTNNHEPGARHLVQNYDNALVRDLVDQVRHIVLPETIHSGGSGSTSTSSSSNGARQSTTNRKTLTPPHEPEGEHIDPILDDDELLTWEADQDRYSYHRSYDMNEMMLLRRHHQDLSQWKNGNQELDSSFAGDPDATTVREDDDDDDDLEEEENDPHGAGKKSTSNNSNNHSSTKTTTSGTATSASSVPLSIFDECRRDFHDILDNMDADDWDVTLQKDKEGHYHLLLERDGRQRSMPLDPHFSELTEDEITQLAIEYFDNKAEEWEESLEQLQDQPWPTRAEQQVAALESFYHSIGAPSILKTNGQWMSPDTPVCQWFGIVCGRKGQHASALRKKVKHGGRHPGGSGGEPVSLVAPDDAVTAIQLNNLDLRGSLPNDLHTLEFLSQLILRNNALQGTLPESLAYASRLCVLDLSNNQIQGTIPPLLPSKMRDLYQLHLSRNHLSGSLPELLRAWRKLWLFDLSQNGFTGTLPKHLGIMTNLAILSLADNMFSGPLPSTMFQMTALQLVDLGSNLFSGSLPSSLSGFHRLRDLNVADNLFYGTFPTELLELSNLRSVLLSRNELVGPLPGEELDWSHTRLGVLHFDNNELTGTLSGEFFRGLSKSISSLDMSDNDITGTLPTEIGALTDLSTINAMHNRISGTLPTEMLRMNPNLRLNFTDNLITGAIPYMFCGEGAPTLNILYREFGCDAVLCKPGTWNPHGHATLHSSCRTCYQVPVGEERILGRTMCDDQKYVHGDLDGDGKVSPREILRMLYIDNIGKHWGQAYNNWADIRVHECDLVGITCSSRKIVKIDLSNANMCSNGERKPGNPKFCLGIPSEIGLLTTLELFQASRRQYLRGTLPTELGRLTRLRHLDMSSCPSMKGSIPTELGKLTALKSLLLSHGPFTGTIPSGILYLTNLEKLHLTKNMLVGTLPHYMRSTNLKEFMISRNDINGTLPTQLGRLTMLENLEVYGNQFTGSIPTELGRCKSLKRVDIFNNLLTGTIPSELALIDKLQIIHVKQNKLTGTIPSVFGRLPSLSWFDMSDNNLYGTIPETFENNSMLKDLRLADNMFYGPIPRKLCENTNINSEGSKAYGCAAVACPLGTYSDLGFAVEKSGGCKPCPDGKSTLYLASTKCRPFSTEEILTMFFEVFEGGRSWPQPYKETWQNLELPVCEWWGVRCDENGEIIGLKLPMVGSLDAHI